MRQLVAPLMTEMDAAAAREAAAEREASGQAVEGPDSVPNERTGHAAMRCHPVAVEGEEPSPAGDAVAPPKKAEAEAGAGAEAGRGGGDAEGGGARRVLLVGLHTCGDLGPALLRCFVQAASGAARGGDASGGAGAGGLSLVGVVSVGCCYHRLTEDCYTPLPRTEDHAGAAPAAAAATVAVAASSSPTVLPGYPLSARCRRLRLPLGETGRHLALRGAAEPWRLRGAETGGDGSGGAGAVGAAAAARSEEAQAAERSLVAPPPRGEHAPGGVVRPSRPHCFGRG